MMTPGVAGGVTGSPDPAPAGRAADHPIAV